MQYQPSMRSHSSNPSTQEAEAHGSLGVQSQSGLQNEFQVRQRNPVWKNHTHNGMNE
ncbi:hypothetical protein ACRRTK_007793 [Alexandromys fortis]